MDGSATGHGKAQKINEFQSIESAIRMQILYLSRRNLQVLLNKLDRNLREPGSSECTIVKKDQDHPKYPCSDVIIVRALENEEYYTDREPGEMLPEDVYSTQ